MSRPPTSYPERKTSAEYLQSREQYSSNNVDANAMAYCDVTLILERFGQNICIMICRPDGMACDPCIFRCFKPYNGTGFHKTTDEKWFIPFTFTHKQVQVRTIRILLLLTLLTIELQCY